MLKDRCLKLVTLAFPRLTSSSASTRGKLSLWHLKIIIYLNIYLSEDFLKIFIKRIHCHWHFEAVLQVEFEVGKLWNNFNFSFKELHLNQFCWVLSKPSSFLFGQQTNCICIRVKVYVYVYMCLPVYVYTCMY